MTRTQCKRCKSRYMDTLKQCPWCATSNPLRPRSDDTAPYSSPSFGSSPAPDHGTSSGSSDSFSGGGGDSGGGGSSGDF